MFKRWIDQVKEFFADTRNEVRKVSFPTRTETLGSTTVVLVFVLIVGVFLALVDLLLARVVRMLIG
jgi:preprotein translocase subunit SecE